MTAPLPARRVRCKAGCTAREKTGLLPRHLAQPVSLHSLAAGLALSLIAQPLEGTLVLALPLRLVAVRAPAHCRTPSSHRSLPGMRHSVKLMVPS